MKTVDELRAELLADLEMRTTEKTTLPVRLQNQAKQIEKMDLFEQLKRQLVSSLQNMIMWPHPTQESGQLSYNRDRNKLVEEWGGDEYERRPLAETMRLIEAGTLKDDAEFRRFMGNHYYPDAGSRSEPTRIEAILDGHCVEMNLQGDVAFSLDGLREQFQHDKADFRLLDLSDYKLSQPLQAGGAHKIRLMQDKGEGQRHRYMTAWELNAATVPPWPFSDPVGPWKNVPPASLLPAIDLATGEVPEVCPLWLQGAQSTPSLACAHT